LAIETWRVTSSPVCSRRHLGQLVPDHLALGQLAAESLPLAGPLQGQVEAAAGNRITVDGKPQPLRLEVPHQLQESGPLPADQVLGRHPGVLEGELGGVRAEPAHLLELAADGEARRAPLHDQQ
jgi:hypothetical protein